MSCDRSDTILHGYFDGELGAIGAAEFERHLEECTECAAVLDALKSLRTSMKSAQLHERAPVALRKKVLENLRSASPASAAAAPTPWRWLAIAAAVLLFCFAGWQFATLHRGDNNEAALAAEVVDAHLRSLQPGHLTDVLSTDQHTVKPWFDGKLDFSPPVRDFADQGFPLQGGRLDVVHGRTVAALVYGRRKHLVSVFIWPSSEPDGSLRAGSRQGYQWMSWRKGGMEFHAASDVSAADMGQLQRLLAE
jgi:anti-sigma factor (TIGR02949 family)